VHSAIGSWAGLRLDQLRTILMKRLLALIFVLSMPAWAGFTHVQGVQGFFGSTTSGTQALGAAPTAGNLVCVGIRTAFAAVNTMTVKDANNNIYAASTNSPYVQGNGTTDWLYYLAIAPANASATINFAWTGTGTVVAFIEEFGVSGGTATFDKDITGTGTGTSVNTPSITPTNANSLLWATAYSINVNMTAPAADATLGGWTGAHGNAATTCNSEYMLSDTGAQAVAFTASSSVVWTSMAMSFYITAAAPSVSSHMVLL
jgi:hypothetical protein